VKNTKSHRFKLKNVDTAPFLYIVSIYSGGIYVYNAAATWSV